MERIGAGVSTWDKDLRLVAWNRAFRDLLVLPDIVLKVGASLAEIVDGGAPGFGDRPDGQQIESLGRKRLAADRRFTFDRRFADGRCVSLTFAPFAPDGWIVVCHAVTRGEIEENQNELQRQNARLDAALDSMPGGFSIWDDDLRLVLFNSRYAEIYGMPRDQLRVGMSLLDICELTVAVGNHPGVMPDELFRRYRDRLRQNMDPAITRRYEKAIRRRTIRSSYTRDPRLGWVVTHEDITDDIRRIEELGAREAALAQQNMRLDAAVNNISQGLCMFDADRRLVICNRNYATLYGLPAELVRPGTHLADILKHRIANGVPPLGDKQAYLQRRLDVVAAGKPEIDTVELRDGRVISIRHLPTADGGWVATHEDVTEQHGDELRIRHLARHDPLTDLPNRLVFRESMTAAEDGIADGRTFAVLAIDLDRFKSVNDTLGHAVGDAVLKMVADRLKAAVRDSDVAARLGGDEFAILSSALAHPEDAAVLAERIVRQIGEPFVYDGHNIEIGASIGIAVAPGDGRNADTLLKNADLALYRAKTEGRGAYHFFEQDMDAALQRRRVLETGLRQAIARNELRLVFQPVFNLADNRVSGLEALVRWYHPERGTISPAEFIPIAERSGLIIPIGEWVLRQACAAAASWPDDITVSVNLSAVQFRSRGLLQHVRSALQDSGLRPQRLELEVTESLLLAEVEFTLPTLHQLRGLGVRVSMDDFGTGYSSLSYLRSFPFDKVKIDQSFVRDLASGEGGRAIVSAVIGLGRSLGMSTTAEGVETEDQLDLVRDQGCTEVQGFLLSPPLPASAVDKLFAKATGTHEWTRTLARRSGATRRLPN
ncbi:MAG: EAL domain-containing protein [Bauldia sp.]